MHVFFSGIGGTAIGPLALLAKQAGYTVSGSDKQDSQYIRYLRKKGLLDIHIGQDRHTIEHIHDQEPIDWYVYSSAVSIENSEGEEFKFCHEQGIKTSKRDEFINLILDQKKLKLIAVAGTHGKTTTTAMVIWLMKELKIPISYSVGAKIPFGDMGQYEKQSEYFVYECDEFDRNFLSFNPYLSLITGVSWDHHEIFPTREDYIMAFREFIEQSEWTILWKRDQDYLGLKNSKRILSLDSGDISIEMIKLAGRFNREDAKLAIQAVEEVTGESSEKLTKIMDHFPGLQRRMEELSPGLYSDYAHTPEKIRGAMSVALETAARLGKKLIVIYEPLTNRRQHYMIDDYKDCFEGAEKVYWLPSYLAREDPSQRVIPPEELISHLTDPSIAESETRSEELLKKIKHYLGQDYIVVGMAGGGGDSLDEWLRSHFTK